MGDLVLVDTQTDLIRGRYTEPADFSISGRYNIHLPSGFNINPQTNVVSDLLQEKIDTFIRLHPSIPDYFNDELLAVPNIDTSALLSTRYFLGPNKRTAILPGGYVTTNAMTTAAGFGTTYIHVHAFTLYSDPGDSSASHPSPSRLLYNYDPSSGFFTFDHNHFTVQYRNSIGIALLHTATPELEDTTFTNVGALTFTIRFINNHPTRTYYLSDWMFMYGP